MKYEAYCLEEIQQMLDCYKQMKFIPIQFEIHNIEKDSENYTAENYLRLYDNTCYYMSRKEFVKNLSAIRNSKLITPETKRVINKLIGDKKLFKKFKFCSDGSYRNGRIFGHVVRDNNGDYQYSLAPNISHKLWLELGFKHPEQDPIKYINWLYNHFDTIFVQIPMRLNDTAIRREIAQQKNDNAFNWAG